jgi:hypothetical protein
MTKKTIIIAIVMLSMAGYIAYSEGMKAYQAEKSKWITAGALQMREVIFNEASKGETRLSNAKGDKTIIIIKK